jgi:hypothetical protein
VEVLGTGCQSLLEDIQTILLFIFAKKKTILCFTASFIFFRFYFYHCIYGCMFCALVFDFVCYVSLLPVPMAARSKA